MKPRVGFAHGLIKDPIEKNNLNLWCSTETSGDRRRGGFGKTLISMAVTSNKLDIVTYQESAFKLYSSSNI